MEEILISNPLLTVFTVVTLGALIGAIPLGPIKLGGAGALFVGLTLSAIYPQISQEMTLLQGLGLALFVYTIGISAGRTFFTNLRRGAKLLICATAILLLAAIAAILTSKLLNLKPDLVTGIFTGALTAAPALDTATHIADPAQASVGYALGYPLAVIIGIIVVSTAAPLNFPSEKDTPSLNSTTLLAQTIKVRNHQSVREVPGWQEGLVKLSYLQRRGKVRVVAPGEDLEKDDLVVIVGQPNHVQIACQIGEIQDTHLADHRQDVEFKRFLISNPEITGRTVGELNMAGRFGAVITRVRRGDLKLLARDDLELTPGDRVAVVCPRNELENVAKYLGDSERRVSEIDALGIGLGMVLGITLGMIYVPLPEGLKFSLGPAAGPLLVGMILGALRRTGPIIWTMPESTNLTIRQLGLLFFLSALGLGAGPEFAKLAFSSEGIKAGILAAIIAFIATVGMVLSARLLKLSAPRAAGAAAGLLGQPAVLEAANNRLNDERIEAAYATLFAWAMVVKIALVPLVFTL